MSSAHRVSGYLTYLVRVRSSDEDDRTPPRDFPRTARMHLAEEQVHQYGKRPEEYIVNPICHLSIVLLLLLRQVWYMLLNFGLLSHLGCGVRQWSGGWVVECKGPW